MNRSLARVTAVLLAVVAVGLLLSPNALATPGRAGLARAAAPSPGGSAVVAAVGDDGVAFANQTETGPIVDTLVPGTVGLTVRSYSIEVRVGVGDVHTFVELSTDPIRDWSAPSQPQGGPDALPPISEWNWTVAHAGRSDTANWTLNGTTGLLSRPVTWQNATFVVTGRFVGHETVAVAPGLPDGTIPTALSYSLNGWAPGSRTGLNTPLTAPAEALRAPFVRFGLTSIGTIVGWNNATGAPVLNFTHFDAVVGFLAAIHANAMVSLPAGTWGNGNTLPAGMPLDVTTTVPYGGSVGFFPAKEAYASLVAAIATHVRLDGESVAYWEVGNEVPAVNATEVARFAALITVAATAIHASLPTALVSADDITNRHYLDEFAADTTGVGFLSFHYYPSNTLCLSNGTYCPPGTFGLGVTDSGYWDPEVNISSAGLFLAPRTAQSTWRSDTGAELPILNTESNLNAAGGGANASTLGTDPRLQTLFGAAWLGSTLIDASRANVSSFTYFRVTNPAGGNATVTLPYGGFGFGMTAMNLSGSFIEFAPYWAAYLWANSVPAGSVGVRATTSGSNDVAAYAVREGTNVSVVLVNRMATEVNTTVEFPVPSGWTAKSLSVLDRRGYVESNATAPGPVTVARSGYLQVAPPESGGAVEVDGYGLAVLSGTYAVPANNSNGSANTSGPGTQPPPNGINGTGPSGSSPTSNSSGAAPGTRGPSGGHRGAGSFETPQGRPGLGALGVDGSRWAGLGVLAMGGLVVVGAWRASAPLPPVARPPARGRPAARAPGTARKR
jgi:hypothetical protein